MKKLFTVVALLACFMGANAKTVVDAELSFADATEVNWAWGGLVEGATLDIQDGCLHYSSPNGLPEGANNWDSQFVLNGLGGISVEVDVTYTLEMEIKGTEAANWWLVAFAGVTDYGEPQLPITTDWQVLKKEYVATSATSDSNPKFQCGNYKGEFWVKYIKITHEEADEEQPVQWESIITNGDASSDWDVEMKAGTDEGWENVVAWSKEWGYLMEDVIMENGVPASDAEFIPRPHPSFIENGVFVSHAKEVTPVIHFTVDVDYGWAQYASGDEAPHNTWQNQFWINYPRTMKSGEQIRLQFDYKASKAVTVSTQDHKNTPGDYLGGGTVGSLNFETEWKTFDKVLSAADGVHSLAFNLTGDGENWKQDIDFYFDNINVSTMVLDHGYFVAYTDIEDGDPEYKFSTAVELVYNEEEDAYIGTVGTAGDQESWVNQIMISTVRGNDKAFKAATLKTSNGKIENDEWAAVTSASGGKIDLPARGVYTVQIGIEEDGTIMLKCTQVEGEEIVVKEKIDVYPNESVVTLKGMARDDFSDVVNGQPQQREEEGGAGESWDNQFFILANRTLNAGEETVIEFDYVCNLDEARTTTQFHGNPGAYMHWQAIGDVTFTSTEQHFSQTFTVPAEADGMQSIAFNMAEIQGACDYTIKNVVWKLSDDTETLINMEGVENFYVKEGVGTEPHVFGTIYGMWIVGQLTGGWPAVSEIGFEDWSVAKRMTRDAENPNIYTLATEVEITEEGQYDYKATANSRWGVYELPMEGNNNWVFEAGRNYPVGKYNLLFTANTEEHTLVLEVTPQGGEDEYDGDVNADGGVDVADISAVISHMAGTEQYEKADVNKDGGIDVADISAIITIMAENARRAALIAE